MPGIDVTQEMQTTSVTGLTAHYEWDRHQMSSGVLAQPLSNIGCVSHKVRLLPLLFAALEESSKTLTEWDYALPKTIWLHSVWDSLLAGVKQGAWAHSNRFCRLVA